MTIIVAATDEQWAELTGPQTDIKWQRVDESRDFFQHKNADAFFSLKDNSILLEFAILQKPVFINAVIQTLKESGAPANVLRINGWTTFLIRSNWEIAGSINDDTVSVLQALNKKINTTADEPGFISARVISMIINEAYFAVEDNVSSKQEIDTAMKLGTNYPYGPFEWAALIGTENILALLQKLNETDARYQPAELLYKEVNENK